MSARMKSPRRALSNTAAKSSPLARSVSVQEHVAAPTFIAAELIKTQKFGMLVLAARKGRISAEDLAEAAQQVPLSEVEAALCTFVARLQTTTVHELMRTGTWAVRYWIVKTIPHAMLCALPETFTTPLHLLAQHSPGDPHEQHEMASLMCIIKPKYFEARDFQQYTPAHYIALCGHESAYSAIERHCPILCNTAVSVKGDTPASFSLARMRQDLTMTRRENTQLRVNHDAVDGSSVMLQALNVGLHAKLLEHEQRIADQETTIANLSNEQKSLREKERQLLQQTTSQTEDLFRLRNERDDARTDANNAHTLFTESVQKLQAQKTQAVDLETQLQSLKKQMADSTAAMNRTETERATLSAQVRALRDQCTQAESAAAHAADTVTAAALEHNRTLQRELSAAEQQLSDLEAVTTDAKKQRADLERAQNAKEQALVQMREQQLQLQLRMQEAQQRSEALEQTLAHSNERYRSAELELGNLRKESDELRREQDKKAKEYGAQISRMSLEREQLQAKLSDAQAAVAAAKSRLADESPPAASIAHETDMERAERARAESERAEMLQELNRLRIQTTEAQKHAQQLQDNTVRYQQTACAWDKESSELRNQLSSTQEMLRQARQQLEMHRALNHQQQQLQQQPHSPRPPNARPNEQTQLLRRTSTLRALRVPRSAPDQYTAGEEVTDDGSDAATEAAEIALLRRNAELNEVLHNNIVKWISNGEHEKLIELFNLGVNPNLRIYGTLLGSTEPKAQTMLEMAVRTAYLMMSSGKLMQKEEREAKILSITKLVPLIVQRGGDWDELDDFLHENDDELPPKMVEVLRRRDDISPFCRALCENRAADAEREIHTVENFDRIPTKFQDEEWTYLHIAVLYSMAAMVTRLIQTGMVRVNALDKKKRTPLHLALQKITDERQRRIIIEYLLAGGARPTQKTFYSKLIDMCKAGASSTRTTLAMKRAVKKLAIRSKKPASDMINAPSQLGTPLCIAQSLQDPELEELFENRRYWLPTVDKRENEEYGTPLLQDYVIKAVEIVCLGEELLQEGLMREGDKFHRIYMRYRDVYQCFNPHYGGSAGYNIVIETIRKDADVDEYMASGDLQGDESALARMIALDEAYLQALVASDKDAVAQNASLTWKLVLLLMQCTKAVSERWFEVSAIINEAAHAMYGKAVITALRHMIEQNNVAAIEYMLFRQDKPLGNVDVYTIVDEVRGFTPIELAAHCAAVEVYEVLLDRQRARIDKVGANGRTLISIAEAAAQPIIIVATDYFKHINKLDFFGEIRPNSQRYGILTDGKNTVLHQCAARSRPDLLEFCVSEVRFQLRMKNKADATPLEEAELYLRKNSNGFRNVAAQRRATACCDLLRQYVAGATEAQLQRPVQQILELPPPPRLELPPPLTGSQIQHSMRLQTIPEEPVPDAAFKTIVMVEEMQFSECEEVAETPLARTTPRDEDDESMSTNSHSSRSHRHKSHSKSKSKRSVKE